MIMITNTEEHTATLLRDLDIAMQKHITVLMKIMMRQLMQIMVILDMEDKE